MNYQPLNQSSGIYGFREYPELNAGYSFHHHPVSGWRWGAPFQDTPVMVVNKGTVFQRSLGTVNELFIVRPRPKTGHTAKVYNVLLGAPILRFTADPIAFHDTPTLCLQRRVCIERIPFIL